MLLKSEKIKKKLKNNWPVIFAAILYLPFIFTGFGIDVDTFRVIDAGKNFIASADYVPSRNPGYLVHEMCSWLLNTIGGSPASNLGTYLLSLIGISSFLKICKNLHLEHPILLTLILILHPMYWFNSTCTIDYIWACSFILIGFKLMFEKKNYFAALAFGLSIGSRLASFIAVGGILLYFLQKEYPHWKKIIITGMITAILSCALYILPLDFVEWEMRLFNASVGDASLWSFGMRGGRYLYKNFYFWSIPVILYFFYFLYLTIRNRKEIFTPPNMPAVISISFTIIAYQFLFFRYPIAPEYLLSSLPFCIIAFGLILKKKRNLIIILIALILISNFVTINIARPNIANQASSAEFGFWLEDGYLFNSMQTRKLVQDCQNKACFVEIIYPENK